jgi:hypothetical protein
MPILPFRLAAPSFMVWAWTNGAQAPKCPFRKKAQNNILKIKNNLR